MLQTKSFGSTPPKQAITAVGALLCFVAFLVFIKDIASLQMLYVSSDEMGYLGTAAYLSGIDWSGVLSHLYYYSYGYSLLLAPLFSITNNPVLVYQLAILLNALMMVATIPLSYQVGKRLFPGANPWLTLACCFCISMYSAGILQITMARNESLLFLLVWVILLLFLLLKNSNKLLPIALIAGLSFYAFMVHQRAIAIVISAAVVVFIMFLKKRLTPKQFLLFCAVLAGMFVLHTLLKEFVKSNIWHGSITSNNNDFSGISGKLQILFTGAGAANFAKALLGQLFYLGVASFLLYYAGAALLVPRAWRTLRQDVFTKKPYASKAEYGNEWAVLFLVFSCILTILLSALFLIKLVRMDHVLYGRYNEIFIAPVLLYTLLYLMHRRKPVYRMAGICASLFVVLGIVSYFSIQGLPNFSTISAPGMAWLQPFFQNNWLYVILIPLVVFAAVLLLTRENKHRVISSVIALGMVTVLFVYAGFYPITHTVLPAQQQNQMAVEAPKTYIEENGITNIYGYAQGEDAWQFSYLQFAMPARPITMLNEAADITALPDGSTVITTASGLFLPQLVEGADIITSSGKYIVWSINRNKDTASTDIGIPLSLFSTQTGAFTADFSSIRSSGQAGYLLYGPYLSIPAGNYQAVISLSPLKEISGNIGYADISINGQQAAVQEIVLDGTSTMDLNEIRIPFALEQDTDLVEIRLFLNEGIPIEVYNIFLEK